MSRNKMKIISIFPALFAAFSFLATTTTTTTLAFTAHQSKQHPKQQPQRRRRRRLVDMTDSSSALPMQRDEYLQPHFEVIMASKAALDIDRMVECASSEEELCDVQEMSEWVQELEQLNQSTKRSNSSTTAHHRERNKVLQQALELQIELQQTRGKLQSLQKDKVEPSKQQHIASVQDDHAFDHFVDYHSMGEFESH